MEWKDWGVIPIFSTIVCFVEYDKWHISIEVKKI